MQASALTQPSQLALGQRLSSLWAHLTAAPAPDQAAWHKVAVMAAAYATIGQFSLTQLAIGGAISAMWLPFGLAFAMILLGGSRYAWGVLIAELGLNLFRGSAYELALVLAVGNTMAVLAGVHMLTRRGQFETVEMSLRNYLRMVLLGGLVTSLFSAANGVLALLVFNVISAESLAGHLFHWWMGDMLGITLLAPLILLWHRPPREWFKERRWIEVVLLLLVSLVLGRAIFLDWFGDSAVGLGHGYLMFVLTVAVTMRLGPHAMALVILASAVLGLAGGLQGVGYFASGKGGFQMVEYWVFVMSLSLVGMALSAYFNDLKRAASALSESQQAQSQLFHQNAIPMLLADADTGRVLDANLAAINFYGFSAPSLLGMSLATLNCETSGEPGQPLAATRPGEGTRVETRHRLADGSERDVALSSSTLNIGGKNILHCNITDITERKRAESERQATLQLLRKVTSQVPGAVYQFRLRADGTAQLPYASEGIKTLYAVSAEEASERMDQIVERLDPDDLETARKALTSSAKTLTPWVAEYRVRQADGSVRWHANTGIPQPESDGSMLWHGYVSDVTERKSTQDEIEKLAFYDPLTSLPNRRLLMDRMQKVLAASQRTKNHVAVFLMDMDKFKGINDNFGHDAGDTYLRLAAERMNACLRTTDTASRYAGDEFVVLLNALSSDPDEALAQTQAVGEKLLRQFQLPYQLGSHVYQGSASIGVCLSDRHDDSPLELLKRANIAVYEVKEAGGNGMRFFAPEMQAAVDARIKMAADFRRAMDEHQFVLFYQDQVNPQGQLIGAEVLLRWAHPELGLVTPDAFIPHAEDTGLIMPLGLWVLETTCVQLAKWASRPESRHMTLSVNVSAKQFQHADFVDSVLDVVLRTGAPPHQLLLELTESVMVTAIDEVVAKMLVLREKGIGLGLDDFGTGYSSLAYLRKLPLNQLKIDKSFVRDIVKSANISIARSIVTLGQGMGLQVVAEGVESAAQVDILAQLGVDVYQGYYFGRPKSPEDFERLFEPDFLLPPSSIE